MKSTVSVLGIDPGFNNTGICVLKYNLSNHKLSISFNLHKSNPEDDRFTRVKKTADWVVCNYSLYNIVGCEDCLQDKFFSGTYTIGLISILKYKFMKLSDVLFSISGSKATSFVKRFKDVNTFVKGDFKAKGKKPKTKHFHLHYYNTYFSDVFEVCDPLDSYKPVSYEHLIDAFVYAYIALIAYLKINNLDYTKLVYDSKQDYIFNSGLLKKTFRGKEVLYRTGLIDRSDLTIIADNCNDSGLANYIFPGEGDV